MCILVTGEAGCLPRLPEVGGDRARAPARLGCKRLGSTCSHKHCHKAVFLRTPPPLGCTVSSAPGPPPTYSPEGQPSGRERLQSLSSLPPPEPKSNLRNPMTSSRGARAASQGHAPHPTPNVRSFPSEAVGAGTAPKEKVGCQPGSTRTLPGSSSPAPSPRPAPSAVTLQ